MAQEPAPAKPLYDVHSHVLFDIDDGATDEAMALDMLRLSSERGVTTIVATPHSQDVREHGGLPTFQDRMTRTHALLKESGIPIELVPGMEIHLMPDVPELLASGEYLPLNGTRYVLIELDFVQWASFTDDLLFRIALGVTSDSPACLGQTTRNRQACQRGLAQKVSAIDLKWA